MLKFKSRPGSRGAAGLFLAFMLTVLIPSLGLVGAVGFAPAVIEYHLEANSLRVNAHVGLLDDSRTFSRADVISARGVEVSGSVHRTRGTGLPGYCAGQWTVDGVGAAWAAFDCGRRVVVIDVAGENILLSPPDREAFLAAMNAPGSTYDTTLPRSERGLFVQAGAAFAMAMTVLTLALLGRLFRRLEYTIVPGGDAGAELVVPAFFSPVRVKLRGARARRGPMVSAIRLGGAAVPGVLYLGLFRSPKGWLHVAATSVKEGWTIEGQRTVFVSPADDEAFAAALTSAGAELAFGVAAPLTGG